jgi:hypothetical protein
MSEYPQHGLHPDPDMLNSFVEGVLPEHERLACLQHFAECASCREVVYLAQEPLAPEPLPVPATDRAAWWKRWLKPIPALSAVVAAGIIIFSVALYRPDKPAPNTPKATVAMSAPQAANEPLAPASPPVLKALEAPLITTQRAATKAAPHPATPTESPQAVTAQGLSKPAVSLPSSQPSAFLPAAPAPTPARAATLDAVAPAQSAIAGTITDPSGAAITGAKVALRQASGAPGVNAISDNSGQFFIAGLQPGQYELQVTSAGFQRATKEVEVQKDQVARADSSLIIGPTMETVEVTASNATINSESLSVANTKSGAAKLPLVGRMATKKSAPAASDSVSLPGGLATVATVAKGKVTLAADSAGTLYRSDDAGRKWKVVKAVWQGKAVELAADPPTAEAAAFRLTTDAGTAWFSRDGSHWYAAPPQR